MVVLAAATAACTGAQQQDAPDQRTVNGHGLLWRIDHESAAPSYVFGTMHVSDPRVLDLPDEVRTAFSDARSVGLESELMEQDEDRFFAMMRLPPDRTLESIIGPDFFNALALLFSLDQAGRAELQLLKPWAVAEMIGALDEPQGDLVLDDMLARDARAQGKDVFTLETAFEQMAAFDALPEVHQVSYLYGTIVGLAASEEERTRERESIVRSYLARSTGPIFQRSVVEAIDESDSATRTFLQTLYFARNKRFVDRMVPWVDKGGAFVAVGSLHLPGEEGVISLLRKRGYEVSLVY